MPRPVEGLRPRPRAIVSANHLLDTLPFGMVRRTRRGRPRRSEQRRRDARRRLERRWMWQSMREQLHSLGMELKIAPLLL